MDDDGKVVYLKTKTHRQKRKSADADDFGLLEDLVDHLDDMVEMHRDVIRNAHNLLQRKQTAKALAVLSQACEQIEMGDDWCEDEDGHE